MWDWRLFDGLRKRRTLWHLRRTARLDLALLGHRQTLGVSQPSALEGQGSIMAESDDWPRFWVSLLHVFRRPFQSLILHPITLILLVLTRIQPMSLAWRLPLPTYGDHDLSVGDLSTIFLLARFYLNGVIETGGAMLWISEFLIFLSFICQDKELSAYLSKSCSEFIWIS